jgi:hypothetical protein
MFEIYQTPRLGFRGKRKIKMTNFTASQIKVSSDGSVFANSTCIAHIRNDNGKRSISLRDHRAGQNAQVLPARTWTNAAVLNEFCAAYINAQA